MKLQISLIFFLMLSAFLGYSDAYKFLFEKAAYFQVMKDGKLEDVNEQLGQLEIAKLAHRTAYFGAMEMKKAGLVANPAQKLDLFKDGRKKLESSINSDKNNPELRFLRLIIQEHAPKIVKYKSNTIEDSELITKHFKLISPVVQQAIIDYSRHSAILDLRKLTAAENE